MTRQKKEIVKRIAFLADSIDQNLVFGCVPKSLNLYYDEIERLEEQLARLSHYSCREEMLYDDRGCRV